MCPKLTCLCVQEPTKAELLAYETDKSTVPARTAYCIVQAFPKSPVNEVELELSGANVTVTSWKQVHASAKFLTTKLPQTDPDHKAAMSLHLTNIHTDHVVLPKGPVSQNRHEQHCY